MTSGAPPSLRLRALTAGTVKVSAMLASLPSSALWLPAARGPFTEMVPSVPRAHRTVGSSSRWVVES